MLAFSEPSAKNVPKAREMDLKALELDSSLADAHQVLGTIYFTFDWDWAKAEQELKRAMQLDPGSSLTRNQYLRAVGK